MIKGWATQDSTTRSATQHKSIAYKPLGRTQLQVSQAGFGGYRINLEENDHKSALKLALDSGINLIDTSANYENGNSERLIGEVLKEGIEKEATLAREDIVIVSKGGYIQGENWHRYEADKSAPCFEGAVELQDGLAHSFHPSFLNDQLTRSLNRLNVETIDCYLIHNPEYYLKWCGASHVPLDKARDLFYTAMRDAFRYLESEVQKGRIRSYGVSCNSFVSSEMDYDFVSLSKLWDIASGLSSQHHFSVVQCPFNIIENNARFLVNQPDGTSFFQQAKRHDLGVLVNRPLNALYEGRLLRLSDYALDKKPDINKLLDYIDALIELEQELYTSIIETIEEEQARNVIIDSFAVGRQLTQMWDSFDGYSHWKDIFDSFVMSVLEQGVSVLSQYAGGGSSSAADLWMKLYIRRVQGVSEEMALYYKQKSNKTLTPVTMALTDFLETQKVTRLSQGVVSLIRSLPEVSSVLVGMRTPDYVKDITEELGRASLSEQVFQETWADIRHQFNEGVTVL